MPQLSKKFVLQNQQERYCQHLTKHLLQVSLDYHQYSVVTCNKQMLSMGYFTQTVLKILYSFCLFIKKKIS